MSHPSRHHFDVKKQKSHLIHVVRLPQREQEINKQKGLIEQNDSSLM